MQMIDCDGHVEESVHTWEYLDPEFYPRRPIPVTLPSDTEFYDWNACWIIDHKLRHIAGSPTTSETAKNKGIPIPVQELTDVGARLAEMDRARIAVQLVNPSLFMDCLAEDVELEYALMRSYNTFMATRCN